MPAGTRVYSCVQKLSSRKSKVSAIRICEALTGQSYMTGRKIHKKRTKKRRKTTKKR